MNNKSENNKSENNKSASNKSASNKSVNSNIDVIVVLLVSFILLVTSALAGIFIAHPLFVALLLFSAMLWRRGFSPSAICRMGLAGARQSLLVVNILLLIGVVTAIWMAAGTVPALVYYGTGLISPRFFILWAFILTGATSVLLGTSFGATGTVGIALMIMARGSGVNLSPVAGAIIAGAFVGDRCSPMSSSAHLVASITRTSLYGNLRNMVISSRWPIALSLLFYGALSWRYPIQLTASPVIAQLPDVFNLSPVVLLPAIAVLLLACLRVDVKVAMLVSVGLGGAIAHHLQDYSLLTLLKFSLFGYQLEGYPLEGQLAGELPLQSILLGGGLLAMAKATLIVLISTAFAGLFTGSRALAFIESALEPIHTQRQLSRATLLVAILSNLFGCTQTIAILLTGQIMEPRYHRYYSNQAAARSPSNLPSQVPAHSTNHKCGDENLALALEDTAVVIAPLIPWNIAGLIPATILMIGPSFIPYAAYLILLPLFNAFRPHSPIEAHPAEMHPVHPSS